MEKKEDNSPHIEADIAKKSEETEELIKEEKKDINKNEDIIGENPPEVGGIAGLLGKTATILGAMVQKEEEAPKISLPVEHVETYKAAFNDFDHNKDGHISTQVTPC